MKLTRRQRECLKEIVGSDPKEPFGFTDQEYWYYQSNQTYRKLVDMGLADMKQRFDGDYVLLTATKEGIEALKKPVKI